MSHASSRRTMKICIVFMSSMAKISDSITSYSSTRMASNLMGRITRLVKSRRCMKNSLLSYGTWLSGRARAIAQSFPITWPARPTESRTCRALSTQTVQQAFGALALMARFCRNSTPVASQSLRVPFTNSKNMRRQLGCASLSRRKKRVKNKIKFR